MLPASLTRRHGHSRKACILTTQLVTPKDPDAFARDFVAGVLAQGFGTLGRRDLELLIFLLLERDGAVPRDMSNFEVARLLRIAPARVKLMRRDAYARWRPILNEERSERVRGMLAELLTEDRLLKAQTHVSERARKEGFLALRVEHADDREQFEQLILDAGGIPVYERNRDVLAVRFDTLLTIGINWGFGATEPLKVRKALQAIAPTASSVKELLKKNANEITSSDLRRVFNEVGADILSGTLKVGVTTLLRIPFTFLS